jgi:hypothetical protein
MNWLRTRSLDLRCIMERDNEFNMPLFVFTIYPCVPRPIPKNIIGSWTWDISQFLHTEEFDDGAIVKEIYHATNRAISYTNMRVFFW